MYSDAIHFKNCPSMSGLKAYFHIKYCIRTFIIMRDMASQGQPYPKTAIGALGDRVVACFIKFIRKYYCAVYNICV